MPLPDSLIVRRKIVFSWRASERVNSIKGWTSIVWGKVLVKMSKGRELMNGSNPSPRFCKRMLARWYDQTLATYEKYIAEPPRERSRVNSVTAFLFGFSGSIGRW